MKNRFNFFLKKNFCILYSFFYLLIFIEKPFAEEQKKEEQPKKIEWVNSPKKQYSLQDTRFNWFERNKKRKEAYLIYNGIMSILEAFKNVTNIFEDKYEEIKVSVDNFNKGVGESLTKIIPNYHTIDDLHLLVNDYKSQIAKLAESEFILKDKELKKDNAKLSQELMNFDVLATQHKNNLELINNALHQIDQSIGTLKSQIERMKNFEKSAWENYQILDELISDEKAAEALNKIKEAQENINIIASYIKNDFVRFFNKMMNDISFAINKFNPQIKDWIDESFKIKNSILNLNQREENEKALAKKKEEDEALKKLERKKKEEEIKRIKELESRPWYVKTGNKIMSFIGDSASFLKSIYIKGKILILGNSKTKKDQKMNNQQINPPAQIYNAPNQKDNNSQKNNFVDQTANANQNLNKSQENNSQQNITSPEKVNSAQPINQPQENNNNSGNLINPNNKITEKKTNINKKWYEKIFDTAKNIVNDFYETMKGLFIGQKNNSQKKPIFKPKEEKKVNVELPYPEVQKVNDLTPEESKISQEINSSLKDVNPTKIEMKYDAVYVPQSKELQKNQNINTIRNSSDGNIKSQIVSPEPLSKEPHVDYVPAPTNYTDPITVTEELPNAEVPEIKYKVEEEKENFQQTMIETGNTETADNEDPFASLKGYDYSNPT